LAIDNGGTRFFNTIRHFKSVFYSGDFTQFAIQLLGSPDEYLVDSVYIIIILNSLGLIKTRFIMSKLLYAPETRNEVRKAFPDLVMEYGTKCIDIQALFSFFLSSMTQIDQESRNFGEVTRLNTLTDATALMMTMEDEQIRVAALALYIINNLKNLIDALLETNSKDLLDFIPHRSN
jgi:hypothetical protein